MPLFEAQFLIAEENIWFAEIEPYQAIQRQDSVALKTQLLIADDAEAAYLQACAMIDNLSEANFDGPGDITNLFCKGICQLREIIIDDDPGQQAHAQEITYLTGTVDGNDVDNAADAQVKPKHELDAFRSKNT
jgi:hypothetical protein